MKKYCVTCKYWLVGSCELAEEVEELIDTQTNTLDTCEEYEKETEFKWAIVTYEEDGYPYVYDLHSSEQSAKNALQFAKHLRNPQVILASELGE